MSHFATLVISQTPEEVEGLLQPYHEYECTGIKDQYVRFMPAEETREEMRAKHREWLRKYPDSTPKTLEGFIHDYYGYEQERGVWGHLTNPDKKWDWWVVGGRWSGLLKLRPGARGAVGSPGVMGSHWEAGPDRVDQCRKRDLDVEGMRAEAEQRAAQLFDAYAPAFQGREIPSWTEIRERHGGENLEAAREEHNQHPVVQALREIDRRENRLPIWGGDLRAFFCGGDREAFLVEARENALVTFAVVKDGRWYQRGRMGWWGMVSDEKEQDQWVKEFSSLLDDLPDDALLTVVDCHI